MAIAISSKPAPPQISNRRWWIALVLSLVSPGLGHIYAGAWLRGFGFAILQYALAAILLWSAPYTILAMIGVLTLFIPLWLLMIVNAVHICRRSPAQVLQPYQRWYALVPIGIVLVVGGDQFVQNLDLFNHSRSFHSPTVSMAPNLRFGEYFIVRTDRSPLSDWQRGEIVVFRGPDNREYVKRIVGLPGDRLKVHENLVTMENVAIRHERITESERSDGSCGNGSGPGYREIWPGHQEYLICTTPHADMSEIDMAVPLGHVFVMGDNRGNSLDSRAREIGPIPVEKIVGKATYIYWAKDFHRIGTRLD